VTAQALAGAEHHMAGRITLDEWDDEHAIATVSPSPSDSFRPAQYQVVHGGRARDVRR